MKNISIYLLIITLIFFTGCASTSVLILDETKYFPPTTNVAILNNTPKEPFTVIAQLETKGAVGTSLPQILDNMRDEAKSIGADAIIPTEDVSEYQQQGLMYNAWLGGYQTIGGGRLPAIRGLAIKYNKNIISNNFSSFQRPKRDLNFGIETLGIPYGLSGGTIWIGKNRFRVKGGKTTFKTPNVYLRDGFEDDKFDLTYVNIEYFMKNNFKGLWFGIGYGSFLGTLNHEEETETGNYENIRLGISLGYQYKIVNNLYLNGWVGGYALITGDAEVPVGNKIFYFDSSIPIVSLDIGWYY